MARVSKAVSCQSAVMRTPPPNDPPVMRRRSEAGDWGKKCLQIGRQLGNSSGDGDVARCLFGAVAAITRIAEDRDRFSIRIDEPILRDPVSRVKISLCYTVIRTGRWRDDLNSKDRRTFYSRRPEEVNAVWKQHNEIWLENISSGEKNIEWGFQHQPKAEFDNHAVEQHREPM